MEPNSCLQARLTAIRSRIAVVDEPVAALRQRIKDVQALADHPGAGTAEENDVLAYAFPAAGTALALATCRGHADLHGNLGRLMEPCAAPNSGIGQMLISSRSLAEYRAMFSLTADDLRCRVLDCPGGASSFTAEVVADGGDATACDPIYATVTPDELAGLALAEIDRGNNYVRAHPDGFVWTFFADPDDHRTTRRAAARTFAAHLATDPDRYIPAALPELPFDDRAFDLVLSSHLLFSYADRLDLDFHHRAIVELVRVARREVRLYPLVPAGEDVTYSRLDSLLRRFDREGIHAHTSEVSYEFQHGARRMLVCARR